MTDLEVMARVAVHPLVVKYRNAFQTMQRRMESAYGKDFFPASPYPKQRGFQVMTEREERDYNNLYLRMNAVRATIRKQLTN